MHSESKQVTVGGEKPSRSNIFKDFTYGRGFDIMSSRPMPFWAKDHQIVARAFLRKERPGQVGVEFDSKWHFLTKKEARRLASALLKLASMEDQ